MKIKYWIFRKPTDGEGGDDGGSGAAPSPTPTPAASPTPTGTPAPAGAAPSPAPSPIPDPAGGTPAPAAKGSEGGVWPDDWRTRMVEHITDPAAREKELKQLGRYATPGEVHRKARALEQRLSSGELKSALSKDAKPEEIAAWRTEQGIPETPDKYDLDLGGGLVIGADDKPLVDEFLKAAHATNQTPEQVKGSLRAYYLVNEQITEKRQEDDRRIQEESTETLRGDWGPEFKRNINLVHGLLDKTCSPEVKDKFLGGRLADGTPIGSSPDALKMLLGLALVDNPAGTVVPSSGGNMAGAIDDEITKIETTMKTNRTAYNKDEKIQARYRELLGARETLNKRKVA